MKQSRTDEALGRLSGISCSISFTSCVICRGANPVDWILVHQLLYPLYLTNLISPRKRERLVFLMPIYPLCMDHNGLLVHTQEGPPCHDSHTELVVQCKQIGGLTRNRYMHSDHCNP